MRASVEPSEPGGKATAGAEEILRRCDELAQISDEPGGTTRGYLSEAMGRVNDRVGQWMRRAGLHTEVDGAGNLIGVRRCGRDDAPVLVIGSHLDTVRDAGAYDGVLGVLLGVAVAEALGSTALPFDLEILGFADEEGLRFGAPFLGSLGLLGELDHSWLERRDAVGITVAEAILGRGGDPESLCRAETNRYAGRRVLGFLEAHIEQGPCLQDRGLPLGILDAIAAAEWLRCHFLGQCGHAGTLPMDKRRDPMPGAAEWILAIERMALADADLVATVGQLTPSPGAGNVIPGEVEMSLDLRHPDAARLTAVRQQLLAEGQRIAERRGLAFSHDVLNRQGAVRTDQRLRECLSEAVADAGISAGPLVTGAGHDAAIMARHMPMAMLMVRSPGGVSHHPDETVWLEDVADALTAMVHCVRRLAEVESAQSQAA